MTSKPRRGLGFLILVAIVAALVVPKIISKSHNTSNAVEDNNAPKSSEKPALQVVVETMTGERLVEKLSTTGTIRASEQTELVSEIAGKVEKILFDEGRRVRSGQVLVRLDSSELQAEIRRIDYRLQLVEQRENRQRTLLDQGVISQADYDFALTELNVLRAEKTLAEVQLEKTTITAPFAGIIGLREISPGSYLSPGTPIATLHNLNSVKIDFTVPEKYASQVQVGGEIKFSIKGRPQPFQGTIYAIEPSVDPETRSLQLRARGDNPDGVLVVGAFAGIELVIREFEQALLVPSIAVIPELGGQKVFVLEEGKAQPRQVETGIRQLNRVQILQGLQAGDRVIVSAVQQLREGIAVTPRQKTDRERTDRQRKNT